MKNEKQSDASLSHPTCLGHPSITSSHTDRSQKGQETKLASSHSPGPAAIPSVLFESRHFHVLFGLYAPGTLFEDLDEALERSGLSGRGLWDDMRR